MKLIRIPDSIRLILLASMALHLTACELVKGIFKAGIWVGVVAMVVVLALIGFGLGKLRS